MKRFWEIDFIRGIAIIGVIIYNCAFASDYFGIFEMPRTLFWFLFPRVFAGIFILWVGISLTLSYSRALKKLQTRKLFSKYLKRGLKIFSLGLLITFITFLMIEDFVLFGILHLIGISVILTYPFLKSNNVLVLSIGIILLALGLYLSQFTFGFEWLLWLGFIPSGFYTIDYFPVLPWFGLVFVGIFLGNILYTDYKRNFNIRDLSGNKLAGFFTFLGRHTLVLYFLHLPVFLLFLYLLTGQNFFFIG